MAVKAGPLPMPTQARVGLLTPRSPWTLCRGWPHPAPFLPCRAAAPRLNSRMFLAACLPQEPGRGGARGRVEREGARGRPRLGGPGGRCAPRWQPSEGLHGLRCEPCQGDLRPWPRARGIQGGDSSWRGAPWSGTSHSLPRRRPRCAVRHRQRRPRAPITSDSFSQKCGWVCPVPSALSHWPPRPALCVQPARQLAGARGTLCDHRTPGVDRLPREAQHPPWAWPSRRTAPTAVTAPVTRWGA